MHRLPFPKALHVGLLFWGERKQYQEKFFAQSEDISGTVSVGVGSLVSLSYLWNQRHQSKWPQISLICRNASQ